MPPEVNPRQVFDRLFGNGRAGEQAEAQTRRERYQRSILDYALDDAKKLKSNLGYTDRRKLDEYLDAVRELAACARELEAYLRGEDPGPARAAAQHAAGLANAVLEETGNLSAVHIVGQIRLAAVDMLRATGMERGEAQELVQTARA